MAKTMEELYLKYVNQVARGLEDDRYFQYLFEMVRAGTNTLQQKNRVFHKVVDEQWLTVIEESLDAINQIIDKPRRFVTTEEEVVPVALAKKITADSVRHLSMNTQFIASDEGGDIQPTRVLNVSTAETYDLYENRFIYHLIQRLVTFIDKRTDVIFWSTGDETQNMVSMESKVDDAYEVIEYKMEMTVKNRQSFAENDSDNMKVFMRIDRVRRMVMALKNSSFCDIMAGCAKVRSPIQRTNLIMKDPDYRTCYKLWQFLESYDDVGYTIVEQDRALEFDEEYLIQLYTNLITNYAVFKSLLDVDRRTLDEETLAKKRKVIKPKFIKQIKEEIVEDYNIPDVEIRKVIIEEVTQAQLDAEAALEEEKKRTAQLQTALEETEGQLGSALTQVNTLMTQAMENATALEEKEQEAENLRSEMATLEADATAQIEELERTLTEERQRLTQEAESRVREVTEQAESRVKEITEKGESRLKEAVEKAEAEARAAAEAADLRAKQMEEGAQARIRGITAEAAARVSTAERKAEAEEAARKEAEKGREIAEAEARLRRETLERLTLELTQAKEQLARTQEAYAQAEREKTRALAEKETAEAARGEAEELRRKAEAEAQARQAAQQEAEDRAAQAAQAKTRAEDRAAQAEAMAQAARAMADQEAQARRLAEERADANSLGKYIVTKLRAREQRDKRE